MTVHPRPEGRPEKKPDTAPDKQETVKVTCDGVSVTLERRRYSTEELLQEFKVADAIS